MALFSFDRKEPAKNTNGNGAAAPAAGGDGAVLAPPVPQVQPQQTTITPERQAYLTQMRVKIHQKLVERLNVQNLRSMPINVVTSAGRWSQQDKTDNAMEFHGHVRYSIRWASSVVRRPALSHYPPMDGSLSRCTAGLRSSKSSSVPDGRA